MNKMVKAIFAILVFSVALAAAGGWINNIIELTECDFKEPYKAEILHGVGIPVAPVGAIIGLFVDLEDGEAPAEKTD
jgi:hypothetical protein